MKQLLLCLSRIKTRSHSAVGLYSSDLCLLFQSNSSSRAPGPVVLIGFHGSQRNPCDEPRHFRVRIQRGRELINKTECGFNQHRGDGGAERSFVIRKGKRAISAHAVSDLELIVWVIVWVNVQGDSPPGCFDVERLPLLGFSVFGNMV